MENRLKTDGDPLKLATQIVAASLYKNYLVYEHDEKFFIALGVRNQARLIGHILHVCINGQLSVSENTNAPFSALEQAVSAIKAYGLRTYGWVNWEMSYAQAGLDVTGLPLAHIFVPEIEVEIGKGEVLIHSADSKSVDRIREIIATPPPSDKARPLIEVGVDSGSAPYKTAVQKAVADIKVGLLQKVILSRRLLISEPVDLIASYLLGRQNNAPVRSFLINLDDISAAGFSPEIVCRIEGRKIEVQPLAGTRAISSDRAETLRLRKELGTDMKEIFEHAISVKTYCEELLEICEPDSVKIDKFMEVEERGSVQHLASKISGDMRSDRSIWDGFCAAFPAVTASGVPKFDAYTCIRKLEDSPRGLYAGAVIQIDNKGDLDTALVLRTVFQAEGQTWLRAGAGIVALSTPEREYQETCEKLLSVSRFLVKTG